MSETRCRFFNTGYCKYKGRCKFVHAEDTCEGNCVKTECLKRHPKPCKYGQKCTRKDLCAYKHTEKDTKTETAVLRDEVEQLKTENKTNLDKIKVLEEELKSLKTKVDKLEKSETTIKSNPVPPKKAMGNKEVNLRRVVNKKKVDNPNGGLKNSVEEPVPVAKKKESPELKKTEAKSKDDDKKDDAKVVEEKIKTCPICGEDFEERRFMFAHCKEQHPDFYSSLLDKAKKKEEKKRSNN